MRKIKHIVVLILVVFHLNGKGQDRDDLPKVDPDKSWGVGAVVGDAWYYPIGMKFFYQKNKHQFDCNIHTDYYYLNFYLGYSYYPNDWKKRADLMVKCDISPYYYRSNYSVDKGISAYCGIGLRLRCFKHFYINGSFQMGENIYHSTRENFNGSNYNMRFRGRAELGLSINFSSFRWKRNQV